MLVVGSAVGHFYQHVSYVEVFLFNSYARYSKGTPVESPTRDRLS